MLKAMVRDASGFKIGMGIQLFDDTHKSGWDVTTAVITDIQDNTIYFDNRGDGIFLYWRVQNGIFRNNTDYANGTMAFR